MVYSFGGGAFPDEGRGGATGYYDREIVEPADFHFRRIGLENVGDRMRPGIGPVGEAYASGFRVKADTLPTRVRYDDKRLPLDLDQFSALTFVSQAARNVIERVEPGIHQFEPVEYIRSTGQRVADMFVLFVCRRLDTVDREHTNMVLSPYYWASVKSVLRHSPELVPSGADPDAPSRRVFSLRQIGDAHLWRDIHITAGMFASDALVDALIEAGLTGFAGSRQEAVP